jgi:hypothetical protein
MPPISKELELPAAAHSTRFGSEVSWVKYQMDAEAVTVVQATGERRELSFASPVCLTL